MKNEFYLKLKECLEIGFALLDEPMAKHTTFKIGGPADYFVVPGNTEELSAVIRCCKAGEIPYFILGNGSNLLVGDLGYRGVVIHMGKQFEAVTFEDRGDLVAVTAEAGIVLSKLANEIAGYGLAGFEFAAGIPGTLGGAVTMNAGAYGGEMKDIVLSVKVVDSNGELHLLDKQEMDFGYRKSIIQKNSYLVTETVFLFKRGNKEEIYSTIRDLNRQRKEKQPLEFPSAGSTFKRPEGYFAGKLIMDAGLRGYRVGDIMVSEKHCGFVINAGNGTAKEARTLISDVDRIVYDKFGVHLEPEVRFLGEF